MKYTFLILLLLFIVFPASVISQSIVSADSSQGDNVSGDEIAVVPSGYCTMTAGAIGTVGRVCITTEAPVMQPSEDASETQDEEESVNDLPDCYALGQNYPNPFNPTTIIEYQLPEDVHVTLQVFNVLGQNVATLVDEHQNAGYKYVEFHAGNLPSGMYIYKLQAGTFTDAKKFLFIK